MATTRPAPSIHALLIANWPTGPHPQTATVSPGLDVAVLRRHVAGREDVRQEQHLFVRQLRRNLERADVGERHADVLGLAAGVAAHHVRVAEQAGGRESVELLGHPGIRVRVVAGRPQLPVAEEAAAAGDRERDDDPIADFQLVVVASDVDDFAHELMAEDVAALHGRNEAVEQV